MADGRLFLFAAATLVPFGRVADMYGAKRVFAAGILVYIFSAVVSGLAPNLSIVLVGRALTGVGAGMVFGTSIALLSLVFPTAERGKTIGVNVTAMFLGFIAGNLAGGFLSFYLGWRSLFFVALGLAVLDVIILASRVRGECELARSKAHDLPGMVLYSATIILAFFGLSSIGHDESVYSLLGCAVLGITFVGWERTRPSPLLMPSLIRNRDFALASVANLALQGALFSVPFMLSLYFQSVASFDSRVAGFFFIIPQSLTVALSPFEDQLADRLSPRSVAGVGCIVGASALLLLSVMDQGSSILVPISALALGGISIALFMPSVINWALSRVARSDYGVASSFTETTRLAGMTLSNAVFIVVSGLLLGSSPLDSAHASEFVGVVRASAFVFLVLCVFAAGVAIIGLRGRRRHGPTMPEIREENEVLESNGLSPGRTQ